MGATQPRIISTSLILASPCILLLLLLLGGDGCHAVLPPRGVALRDEQREERHCAGRHATQQGEGGREHQLGEGLRLPRGAHLLHRLLQCEWRAALDSSACQQRLLQSCLLLLLGQQMQRDSAICAVVCAYRGGKPAPIPFLL